MRSRFMKPCGGPKTAVEMWRESNSPKEYSAWEPTAEQLAHLEFYFGDCNIVTPPVKRREPLRQLAA